MDKRMKMSHLIDFYGPLLSQKQKDAVYYFYNMDYSLNEISELMDISKQAVSENIKRGEKSLEEFEFGLKLREKYLKRLKLIQKIKKKIKDKNFDEIELLLDRLISDE